ncbi:hypothetical protein LCGC14_1769310 [marine sediment metagenome]|uniref:Uncharacterized protein n=1 Tax=marine sediment metagenome TaxID=412755 RepID=A0A0F9HL96_9ZZZZ
METSDYKEKDIVFALIEEFEHSKEKPNRPALIILKKEENNFLVCGFSHNEWKKAKNIKISNDSLKWGKLFAGASFINISKPKNIPINNIDYKIGEIEQEVYDIILIELSKPKKLRKNLTVIVKHITD